MATIPELLAQAAAAWRGGQLGVAEQAYQQVLNLNPNHADALANLGVLALNGGRPGPAAEYLRRSVAAQPANAGWHSNLGVALMGLGQHADAEAAFRESVHLQPDYANAHNNLGSALQTQGRLAEAEAAYRAAVRLRPDYVEAHNSLGVTLHGLGRLTDAEVACRVALRLRPQFVEALNNLGSVLYEQGRLAESEAAYREAVRLQPEFAEAHYNLGMLLLSQGWFPEGWVEYEWRLRAGGHIPPRYNRPAWDGTPRKHGAVLLHAEQGLGDTLLFVRYAPLVKERVGTVLLACPAALVPLLSRCPGIDRIVFPGSSVPAFDAHAPLASLPRLLSTTLDTIPAAVPYLTADPELVHRWRTELSALPGFKVGIAWRGGPQMGAYDRRRSFPLAALEPLARVPGVTLVVLQKGPGREQLPIAAGWPLVDPADRLDGSAGTFMDTAAVMSGLDLVVTCDSAPAHLAGALGVPTWVALPCAADWRWLLEREDSPWYPSLRLFRQPWANNWGSVFERMAAALRENVLR